MRQAIIFVSLLLAWLVVPWHRTGEVLRPETAALRAVQTIHTAEVRYESQHGSFACSLEELGLPAVQYGYKFSLTCHAAGYAVNVVPEIYDRTGNRSFYSDQTMIIHENNGPEPATATSKEQGLRARRP